MGTFDRPPVLVVHGWGGSYETTWQSTGFDLLLREMGSEPIGVDLLGHGSSPRSAEPDDYLDLTPPVLAHLNDGPVDAIGFSLGALTLLRVACERPGAFRRLVLGGIGRNAIEASSDADRRQLVEAIRHGHDGTNALAKQFAQYAHSPGNDPESLAAVLEAPRPPFTADELARVDAQVLVVIGSEDFAGPGDPLRDLIPGAELVTVARCDHFSLTENFTFFDAVFDFLAR